MGTAGLVLGIISCVIALIPIIGIFAVFTALAGFILAIVDMVKKSKTGEKKTKAIIGLILSIVSGIVMIISSTIGFGFLVYNSAQDALSNLDGNSIFSNVLENTQINTTTSETKYSVGQSTDIDGIRVTYVDVDTNFTDYSEYADISIGHKVIKADFEFENIDTTNNYVSSYDFVCYADEYDCDSFFYVDDSTFSATLSAGRKTTGSVYFVVPTNANEIVLEYQPNAFIDEKVTFIVE